MISMNPFQDLPMYARAFVFCFLLRPASCSSQTSGNSLFFLPQHLCQPHLGQRCVWCAIKALKTYVCVCLLQVYARTHSRIRGVCIATSAPFLSLDVPSLSLARALSLHFSPFLSSACTLSPLLSCSLSPPALSPFSRSSTHISIHKLSLQVGPACGCGRRPLAPSPHLLHRRQRLVQSLGLGPESVYHHQVNLCSRNRWQYLYK